MTLDKVNNRLMVAAPGNSRYDVYQLDENGLAARPHADISVGRPLIGRGFAHAPLGTDETNFPGQATFDSVNQRLFVSDSSDLQVQRGARIMVFDLSPESLAGLDRNELPHAIATLGQPDENTWDLGVGPARIGGSGTGLVDEERQLLFFSDRGNSRVLVWDIDPQRLETGVDAIAVIGQPDFYSREAGTGASGLRSPSGLAYDPRRQNLFVVDSNRVMVFDVSDQSLDQVAGFEAFAVVGQPDFESNEPNEDLRKFSNGPISLDYEFDRLLVGSFTKNRVLMFDVSPARLEGASNPDAVAVLGQPDFESTDPAVSQTRLTMARVTVDTDRQMAYVPDGYPAGNRINIFDIHPDRMQQTLTPMISQIGHINPDGEPDFLSRSANDRITPRGWTQGRDVTVDTVDHRLIMSDNYSHRVMIFELDRMNRLLERGATWVFGQEDPASAVLLPGRDATTIKLPLAVEYDESHKRLFVADSWNNRVLVYDMTPGQVESGMPASYVLGQKDFTSYEPAAARNRISFGSRDGHGIGPSGGRSAELSMDEVNQRLFVTDGSNHRVLVYDVHPDRIENGADALAVLGQDDFTSTQVGLSATRWNLPGDLVFDENHQRLFVEVPFQNRVLVFDAHPDRLQSGQAAFRIIGQSDFASDEPGISSRKIRQPDGISYDTRNDRLYVTDKGNQRVLAFDAHPERMQNLPEALSVIGEIDFDTARSGPGDARHHQDRLHDPRGSYFDDADQRLFQTEGLNGRMTVFTLPRESYRIDLPARSNLRYASLDAQLSTGPQPLESGYSVARLSEPGRVAAVSTHLVSRAVMHDQSERESRELISAAMLPAAAAADSALFYVDLREGRDTLVSMVNGHDEAARIRLEFEGLDGDLLEETLTLTGGGQISERVSVLFEGRAGPQRGLLRVEADQTLNMGGLLEIDNGRGEALLAPAPLASGAAGTMGLMAQRRVLPVLTTGAGQHVDYVLMNLSDATVSGELLVMDHAPVAYRIEPGGVFIHESPPTAQPLLTGHGLVRAAEGPAPTAFAVVTSARRDGSLRSAHTVTSHQEGTLFWAPVDTYPDVLHHGDIDAELSVANEGLVHATLYLELFDIDGESVAKYERTVPLGERAMLSLEEVFGRSPIRGTLRVFTDTAVALSLQETTVTVDDEMVVADVPLQATPDEAAGEFIFPVFRNGQSQATELMLINTDQRAYEGDLSAMSAHGDVQTMILR